MMHLSYRPALEGSGERKPTFYELTWCDRSVDQVASDDCTSEPVQRAHGLRSGRTAWICRVDAVG